ncbi:hypothetical protein IW261DRAFT_1570333 [Armillaria novae-zelandiae]|uniref:anthranilate synthase n=1 Tax=Armillaria novae-zelandiae TaxID=153914 RepID=A0AA39U2I6_9AGAR|nr:hypothetical protein IW261DRAFT_1570333 [Armillaria novae-zelandiae]
MHGKVSWILHDKGGCFKGLTQGIKSMQYHSLSAAHASLPAELAIMATTEDSGVIMGMHHCQYTLKAVQYHPESILSEAGDALIHNFLTLCGGTWADNPNSHVIDSSLRITNSRRIVNSTQSGAVCGHHNGKFGFDTFIHTRASLDPPGWYDIHSILSSRYPPYTDKKLNTLSWLFPSLPAQPKGPPVPTGSHSFIKWFLLALATVFAGVLTKKKISA